MFWLFKKDRQIISRMTKKLSTDKIIPLEWKNFYGFIFLASDAIFGCRLGNENCSTNIFLLCHTFLYNDRISPHATFLITRFELFGLKFGFECGGSHALLGHSSGEKNIFYNTFGALWLLGKYSMNMQSWNRGTSN